LTLISFVVLLWSITKPHIGNEQQMLIRNLLEKNGYKYVKGNDDVLNWGHGPIDDFYVYSSLV